VPAAADPAPTEIVLESPLLVEPLAPAARADLRREGERLRAAAAALAAGKSGAASAAASAKSWALVSAPLASRRQSERVVGQLGAVALLQPLPMRAELMTTREGRRAVFWPFPTASDAEKVRQALADRGLKMEVVEF
jgi:hypothetical protein